MNPDCPYCGEPSKLVGGDAVYPHRQDLYSKKFYLCRPCDAYVGCHPNSETPLGRLANAELRRAKMATHRAFDPLWKEHGMRRSEAYQWLAEQLGIPAEECHVGMFDVARCNQAIEVCNRKTSAP
jgi:hypothetical protein